MVLSKRERQIAIVAIAVVMIFAIDRYVWTPIMEEKDRVLIEKQGLLAEMQHADKIFKQRTQMGQEWEEMKKGGLGSSASTTESRILNAIRQWSQDYGLILSSIKPDHKKGEGDMQEIIFHVVCNGTMATVGQFLWQIENTTLPLRITEFQLGSRGEDGRDMSLQLRLSALYLAESMGANTTDFGQPLTRDQ